MKKVLFGLVMVAMLFSIVSAKDADVEKDQAAIKKVILDAYRDGIGNVGDVEAMKKGFHKEFNLLGIDRDGLGVWKLPIADWMKSVEKKKKDGKYPPKEKISFKFLQVDVVGTAGMAKIEFYVGEKLTYTDFLLLYKFKDGWKLVSKIYYQHK
jgi:hypothetical protein